MKSAPRRTARPRALLALALTASLLLPGFIAARGHAQGDNPAAENQERRGTEPSRPSANGAAAETGSAGSPSGIVYELKIEGTDDDDLLTLLRETSQLERLRDKPPASFAALGQRAKGDLETFNRVLRAEGYYAGEVTSRIDRGREPAAVILTLAPGPRFHLESYRIEYRAPEGQPPPSPIDPADLGIVPGMPARSETIVAAQRQAIRHLGNSGYPRAEVADQKAVVDYATGTMSVTLAIASGPAARFGELRFTGQDRVEEDYLRTLSQWPRGEAYDRRYIEELRRTLSATGLFETVTLREAGSVGAGGELPVTVEVTERERRSVGVGVEYSSSEGAGSRFYWEHRNLFGRAERLRANVIVAELRQELSGSFIKPDIWQLDQDLKASLTAKHEDNEAYEEQTAGAFLGLERKWRDNWSLGAGTSFEYSIIDDRDGEETYSLIGLPLTARYDNSDNLLDPTRGFRFSGIVTPYVGVITEPANFLRSEFDASTYYAVLDSDRLILAARGKLGSIVGEKTDDVPATKRFYSGGGGSVRGYEYQTLGPLDGDDDPLGGRSVVEVGLEARIKVTEDIGVVPFVEGGNVFDNELPDLTDELQWGAGLGLRYYTAVGPLRLDVAVPVNRRSDDIDDAFQFYISLGQAF